MENKILREHESALGNLILPLFLILLPVLLIIKFRWDAILPLIIYFQLILIWFQAEIGLRQQALFSIQFNPFFEVQVDRDVSVVHELPYKIYLQNLSGYPAYDVVLRRVLDKENRIIPSSKQEGKIDISFKPCLRPKEKSLIMRLSEDLVKNECMLDIFFVNQLGEFKNVIIFISEKGHRIFHGSMQPVGVLINMFEYWKRFFKFRFKG